MEIEKSFAPTIIGMWQVSGGHGKIDNSHAVEEMYRYFKSGFHQWDLADHYGPAEDFIGELRKIILERDGENELSKLKAFTKWVPTDLKTRWTLNVDYSLKYVEDQIDISLKRMNVEKIDLLQFHWWDYEDPRLYKALDNLQKLNEKGKIDQIGLTNFSLESLKKIIEKGYKITSHQVRFSLTDARVKTEMLEYCYHHNIHLLAFGTIASGFLSNRWLNQNEPLEKDLNRGQFVHKKLIDRLGGWEKFQELLCILNKIAFKYKASISNIASKLILDQNSSTSVIIGARLSLSEHIKDNINLNLLNIPEAEFDTLNEFLTSHSKILLEDLGDIGSEYRGSSL
ncbi:aldo/keto reductase [Bacteriovoracaceae bacterium]|nr:aldo/keto reductase [Bacteriovoracaceae bacterium]